jgi:hypothetical protein
MAAATAAFPSGTAPRRQSQEAVHIDLKKLRRITVKVKLAPCHPGSDDPRVDLNCVHHLVRRQSMSITLPTNNFVLDRLMRK